MTSTTGTAQHPDVSEISDLTEGLLSPSRQAAVRQHLDGCDLCADVRASLEEIRGLLGTLPGPQRMPADIAGRIDAALAAEALLNATAHDDEPSHVSRETEPALQQPDRAPADRPADRPAGRPRASVGPGRTAQARRRRRTAVLGTAFSMAAVGLSVLLFQAVRTGDDADGMKADQGINATQVGPVFSDDSLQGRVHTLLAAETVKEVPDDASKQGPRTGQEPSLSIESSPNSALRSGVPVPPCIQRGTGRTDPALAVEQGTYQGTKAYLVVLPHSSDSSQVEAYVVDAACVDTAPTGKAELLLSHAYPRP
ncbi:anti-sigma factor family protein [Streptomyces sp. NPDC054841]